MITVLNPATVHTMLVIRPKVLELPLISPGLSIPVTVYTMLVMRPNVPVHTMLAMRPNVLDL